MNPQQAILSANSPRDGFKFHLIQTPEDLCRIPGCPWDSCMLPVFRLKGISTVPQCKLNVNAAEFVPATKRTHPPQSKLPTVAQVVGATTIPLEPPAHRISLKARDSPARKSLKIDTNKKPDILYSTPSPSPDAHSLTFSDRTSETNNEYCTDSSTVYPEIPMDLVMFGTDEGFENEILRFSTNPALESDVRAFPGNEPRVLEHNRDLYRGNTALLQDPWAM
ncbi:hypothetical protein FRC17_003279 [Serendipita sp. 399]|nr:hypothetical protein FRC17_003279 [Serendipita sp. 399]